MNLARMLDFSRNDLGYDSDEFFNMFIKSGLARLFGRGTPHYIVGMSGVELALEVLYKYNIETDIEPTFTFQLSPEYWAGWALAYYQWYSGRSFEEIHRFVSLRQICNMYHPYHEMDVSHFAEDMENMIVQAKETQEEPER